MGVSVLSLILNKNNCLNFALLYHLQLWRPGTCFWRRQVVCHYVDPDWPCDIRHPLRGDYLRRHRHRVYQTHQPVWKQGLDDINSRQCIKLRCFHNTSVRFVPVQIKDLTPRLHIGGLILE